MADEFKVAVTVGGREVVASGTVVTRPAEPASITLGALTYSLIFEATEDKKLDVVAEISGANSLKMRLQNFDNALGSSYSAHVGDFNEQPIWLDLFIHAIGEPDRQRLISYTFSLAKGA